MASSSTRRASSSSVSFGAALGVCLLTCAIWIPWALYAHETSSEVEQDSSGSSWYAPGRSELYDAIVRFDTLGELLVAIVVVYMFWGWRRDRLQEIETAKIQEDTLMLKRSHTKRMDEAEAEAKAEHQERIDDEVHQLTQVQSPRTFQLQRHRTKQRKRKYQAFWDWARALVMICIGLMVLYELGCLNNPLTHRIHHGIGNYIFWPAWNFIISLMSDQSDPDSTRAYSEKLRKKFSNAVTKVIVKAFLDAVGVAAFLGVFKRLRKTISNAAWFQYLCKLMGKKSETRHELHFSQRCILSLNVMPRATHSKERLEMRTIGEEEATRIFPDAQKSKGKFSIQKDSPMSVLTEALGDVSRDDPFYPFVDIQIAASTDGHVDKQRTLQFQKQFRDHLVNYISSQYGSAFVAMDLMGPDAIVEEEYIFGVTFEDSGNMTTLNNKKIRILLMRNVPQDQMETLQLQEIHTMLRLLVKKAKTSKDKAEKAKLSKHEADLEAHVELMRTHPGLLELPPLQGSEPGRPSAPAPKTSGSMSPLSLDELHEQWDKAPLGYIMYKIDRMDHLRILHKIIEQQANGDELVSGYLVGKLNLAVPRAGRWGMPQ